jgi:hypothetical protein
MAIGVIGVDVVLADFAHVDARLSADDGGFVDVSRETDIGAVFLELFPIEIDGDVVVAEAAILPASSRVEKLRFEVFLVLMDVVDVRRVEDRDEDAAEDDRAEDDGARDGGFVLHEAAKRILKERGRLALEFRVVDFLVDLGELQIFGGDLNAMFYIA